MAIGFRAHGVIGASTTDPATSPGMPAGFQEGDMHILIVLSKATTGTTNVPVLTVPSGWTAPADNSIIGASGNGGVDVGTVRITMCYRVAVTGDTAPAIDLDIASTTESIIVGYTKGSGEIWVPPVTAVAADTTGSTTLYDPAASSTTILLGSGDWLVSMDGINGDAGTPTLPGTLTVSGITFGSLVNRVNQGTTAGNDLRIMGDDVPYSSGTSTAGPDRSITYSAANAAMAGASVFIKLSVQPRPYQSRRKNLTRLPKRASYGR